MRLHSSTMAVCSLFAESAGHNMQQECFHLMPADVHGLRQPGDDAPPPLACLGGAHPEGGSLLISLTWTTYP